MISKSMMYNVMHVRNYRTKNDPTGTWKRGWFLAKGRQIVYIYNSKRLTDLRRKEAGRWKLTAVFEI